MFASHYYGNLLFIYNTIKHNIDYKTINDCEKRYISFAIFPSFYYQICKHQIKCVLLRTKLVFKDKKTK